MTLKNIIPLKKQVLVKRYVKKPQPGELLVPDDSLLKTVQIIAIGEEVSPRVKGYALSNGHGYPVNIDNERHNLLDESDILAIVEV